MMHFVVILLSAMRTNFGWVVTQSTAEGEIEGTHEFWTLTPIRCGGLSFLIVTTVHRCPKVGLNL